jgi:hypothetical protein
MHSTVYCCSPGEVHGVAPSGLCRHLLQRQAEGGQELQDEHCRHRHEGGEAGRLDQLPGHQLTSHQLPQALKL